jgi:hypothetical chaperone protein
MIGIDFGTSNTVVSTEGPDGVRLVPLSSESTSIPTLLFVDRHLQVKIGHDARRAYGEAARAGSGTPDFRLFQAVKLALKDPGILTTNLFGTATRIEKIVSLYLAQLHRVLVAAGVDPSGPVVVGRPVELSPDPAVDRAVQGRFAEAFSLAGFGPVSFVAEPVAAAVDLVGARRGRALVFDFGGGTLDITVADLGDQAIGVRSSVGAELGGFHLDEDLAQARVRRHFGHGSRLVTPAGKVLELPHDVTEQVVRFQILPYDEIRRMKLTVKELLSESADKAKLRGLLQFLDANLTYDLYQVLDGAKIRLSSHDEAGIVFSVPPHVAFAEIVGRPEFDAIIAPKVAAAEALVHRALAAAGCGADDVDLVIRVGGSSQVPAFAAMLERLFPGRLATGNLFDGIARGLVPAHRRGLGFSSN